MRKVLLLFGCVLLLMAFIVNGEQQLGLEAALALFTEDEVMIEFSDDGRAQLEAAIDAFKSSLDLPEDFDETDSDSFAGLVLAPEQKQVTNNLSRGYYVLADCFLEEKSQQKQAYIKGQNWGEKSLHLNPNFVTLEATEKFIDAVKQETDIAAMYWTYANWARKDEFDKLGAIFRGDPPKILALIERATELDPSYICYGPYRSLGAFWGGLPRLPFGKIRKNLEKARSYLCKVVDDPVQCYDCADCPADPSTSQYLENRLFYAQFYLMEAEKWEEARAVLEEILAEPLGENYSLYNAYSKHEAEILLEKVNEHL